MRFYLLTADPVLRDTLHRQILATAMHSGFWSVWVTCFWAGLNDNTWTARLLDYDPIDRYNDYSELVIVTKDNKGKKISTVPDLKKQLIKKLFYYGFPQQSLHFPGTNEAFLEPVTTIIIQK